MTNEPGLITQGKNIKALKEIARKLGKRTASFNLMDPQVGRSSSEGKDGLFVEPAPSEFFTRKLSFETNGFLVTLRVNDEFLVADVKGSFGGFVLCSFLNNKVFEPSRKLAPISLCQIFGYKVYVGSPPAAEGTIEILQNPYFQNLVTSLHLSKKESLHIGDGYAALYLQRFICEDVLNSLDILYKLLALLPSVEKEPINFQDIPEGFHKLIPLIRLWGISDDQERSEKISKASSNTLGDLVSAVEPEFNAIYSYLASFQNNPLTEQAILLGSLAECASEAKLLMKKRIA